MGDLSEGREIFICSLRFYASNALAGALYLVTIFVGKDTLAASCGSFALHNGGEMALSFSPFFFKLEVWRCISGRPRGGVTVNGQMFPFLSTQYSDEVFFLFIYISATDTTT